MLKIEDKNILYKKRIKSYLLRQKCKYFFLREQNSISQKQKSYCESGFLIVH